MSLFIRDRSFSPASPAVIVSLMASNISSLLSQAKIFARLPSDIVEWRVDHFTEANEIQDFLKAGEELTSILPQPILFTMRTRKEGGEENAFSANHYFELNQAAIESDLFDLVDVELFSGEREAEELCKIAKPHDVKIVLSNHDFEKTPPESELVERMLKMKELGGDVAKIAVMPRAPREVLTLMSSALTMRERFPEMPVIAIAMSAMGGVTRVAGNLFGSCATFAAAEKASAPGQFTIEETRRMMDLLKSKV
jgi:3-dehydroquinate dehydratase-1